MIFLHSLTWVPLQFWRTLSIPLPLLGNQNFYVTRSFWASSMSSLAKCSKLQTKRDRAASATAAVELQWLFRWSKGENRCFLTSRCCTYRRIISHAVQNSLQRNEYSWYGHKGVARWANVEVRRYFCRDIIGKLPSVHPGTSFEVAESNDFRLRQVVISIQPFLAWS